MGSFTRIRRANSLNHPVLPMPGKMFRPGDPLLPHTMAPAAVARRTGWRGQSCVDQTFA